MKFAEDNNKDQYQITAYDDDSVHVNDKAFNKGFIVMPKHFIHDWQPQHYADLHVTDLDILFNLKPSVILLGTGAKQIFPPKEIYLAFVKSGIGFEIMDTQAACRTFNILMSEDRNVAAAMFIS
ncbi:MAG: hypothetical protein DSZ29_06135 [Aquificaceae bacterium]|nr:MAG: hypothetical protein DSZ29_06135 [Aquificaceae bacterium]